MIRLTLSLTQIVFILLPVLGQQYDNTWLMGYNYDQTNEQIEGSVLSFTEGRLDVRSESLVLDLQSSSISISDFNGRLQFYTNGCQLVNWEHQTIENGEEINPGETYNNYCININEPWRERYPGGKQSVLTLPAPREDSVYYLIHEANEIVEESNGNLRIAVNPLYSTKIDMRLNNGRGRVINKNTPILEEDIFYGQLMMFPQKKGQRKFPNLVKKKENGYEKKIHCKI